MSMAASLCRLMQIEATPRSNVGISSEALLLFQSAMVWYKFQLPKVSDRTWGYGQVSNIYFMHFDAFWCILGRYPWLIMAAKLTAERQVVAVRASHVLTHTTSPTKRRTTNRHSRGSLRWLETVECGHFSQFAIEMAHLVRWFTKSYQILPDIH